jgi:hypothetical protein
MKTARTFFTKTFNIPRTRSKTPCFLFYIFHQPVGQKVEATERTQALETTDNLTAAARMVIRLCEHFSFNKRNYFPSETRKLIVFCAEFFTIRPALQRHLYE